MPRLALKTRPGLYGRLKLARLLEMGDEEFAGTAKELEASPLFMRLQASRAIAITPFPRSVFATRRYSGRILCAPQEGMAEILDGESEIARLMRKIGCERFERCFLGTKRLSDAERSRICRISSEQARLLRMFLDRFYVRAEFERPPEAPPRKVFSTVAGIVLQDGEPTLCFFNREAWKGRYRIDGTRLAAFQKSLSVREHGQLRNLLAQMEFLEKRKSSLLKVLEVLLKHQADYLKSGKPARRQPLTQRTVASEADIDPSALNRLISNKAVELPWGTEAPLKVFFPTAKSLTLAVVDELSRANPRLADEDLRRLLASKHRIKLSRRSVAQYRKESALGETKKR